MERIAFTDGEKLCVWEDGKVKTFESSSIRRYREYAEQSAGRNEWKMMGEGARFRGDYERYKASGEMTVTAFINGVDWIDGKLVYCFTVNDSSGVCIKELTEKGEEAHVFSSHDAEILSVQAGPTLLVTVRRNDITSMIGTLDVKSSELVTLTDGDARDSDPSWAGGKILFSSAGVGRTAEGEATGTYAPAEILTYSPGSLEIEKVFADGKYSYLHPQRGEDGALYCIRRPNKEKKSSLLKDILLFPFRILKAVFGFLQAFTVLFGGTSLTSEGDNPAKGRKEDPKGIWVDGNLIRAEKEYKRNKRFKDREYGFIPESWKLVRIADGKAEVLFGGVCSFSLSGKKIYYSDGRHVYLFEEGKHKKLADAELCLCVRAEHSGLVQEEDLFSL